MIKETEKGLLANIKISPNSKTNEIIRETIARTIDTIPVMMLTQSFISMIILNFYVASHILLG